MSRPIVNASPDWGIPETVAWIKNQGAWSDATHRWIGRCKHERGGCKKTHKLEGHLVASDKGSVILSNGGGLYMVGYLGSDPSVVDVRCGEHWCRLHRVVEGTKKSKHTCGARCTNATGPNCDCKCKGEHHGSNC